MGTFERLSVVVIGVILAMILVVAIVTWTEEPDQAACVNPEQGPVLPEPPDPMPLPDPEPGPLPPSPTPDPSPDPIVGPLPDPQPEPTPGPAPVKVQPQTHIVQAGETPGGITRKYYGTSKYWPALMAFNQIEGDLIRVGQELLIPSAEDLGIANIPDKPLVVANGTKPEPGSKWEVKKGQDLPTISRLAYGTTERWTDIWFANRESVPDPEQIPAGTVLALPR